MSTGDHTEQGGIYQIRCLVNDKVYIGSAVNFHQRWKAHRGHLLRRTHHSRHLQAAWDKHGADAFVFEILEHVVEKSNLVEIEQVWLDRVRPFDTKIGYNISPTAGSTLGVEQSPEKGQKISTALCGKPAHPNTVSASRLRMRAMNLDPEFQAKRLAAIVASNQDPELREKRASAQRGRKLHPNTLAALRRRKGEKHWQYGKIKPSRDQATFDFMD